MRKSGTIWLFGLIVFVLPIAVFAGINWYQKHLGKLPVFGEKKEAVKTRYHQISNFALYNQDGEKTTTNHWQGRIVIADFFFTHCPVVCPAMTKNLKKIQDRFSNEDVLINSFTVDPERDSIAQLKLYSSRFGINKANWQLLTGNKADIYRLARNSFMITATDGDLGSEDFIHSEKLVLIDKQKRIRGYYQGTNDEEIQQLIIDIKKLKDEN